MLRTVWILLQKAYDDAGSQRTEGLAVVVVGLAQTAVGLPQYSSPEVRDFICGKKVMGLGPRTTVHTSV